MRQSSGANHGRLHFKTRIVSLVLCIVMVLGMLPVGVFATDIVASGYCGGEGDGTNLTWTLDSDGLLTISGEGVMKDCYSSSQPWNSLYLSIEEVFVDEGATTIGAHAFSSCYELKKVYLSDSITHIGEGAFQYCTQLVDVNIPDKITSIEEDTFVHCESLVSITLPKELTSIAENAFGECSKLIEICNNSSLNISRGSEEYGEVGYYAEHIYSDSTGQSHLSESDGYIFFYHEGNAFLVTYYGDETHIYLPDRFVAWDNTVVEKYEIRTRAFNNYRGVTNGMEGGALFNSARYIEEVTIPDSVTSIGEYAFAEYDSHSLSKVTLGNSITMISEAAFEGCTNLTSIIIPDSVTEIEASAFSGSGLVYAELGEKVESIGSYAFSCEHLVELCNNSALTIAKYDDSVSPGSFELIQHIYSDNDGESHLSYTDDYVFLYENNKGYLVRYLGVDSQVELPDTFVAWDGTSVESYVVFDYAFSSDFLESIKIPDAVRELGYETFFDCNNLVKVEISSRISQIPIRAFLGCADEIAVYLHGDAPTVNTNGIYASFPSKATLYYIEGKNGWVDSEDYDAVAGTWNGYKIEPFISEKQTVDSVLGKTYIQSTLISYDYDTIPEDFFSEGIYPPSLEFTSETEGVFYVVNTAEAYKASFNYTIADNIITIVPDTDGLYPESSFSSKTALYMEIQENGSLNVYDYAHNDGVSLGFTDKGDIFSLKTNEDTLPTIENFTLNGASDNVTIEVGEALTLGGVVKGNGNNLAAVSVAIRLKEDPIRGGEWHTGKDVDGNAINQNIENFNLKKFNDTVVIAGQPFGNMEALGPGDYTVQIYVTNQDGKGFEDEHTIKLTIKEKAVVSTRPTVTGLKNSYTITEGEDLALSFTVKAGGTGGLLNVVTIREPSANEQYYRETNIGAESWTVNANISDLAIGVHTLYVYATATNFTGDPSNDIFGFTVTVNAKQSDEPQTLLERIKYAIVCNEHNTDFAYYADDSGYKFDSVTIDDKDATAIGIYQWRGSRAFDIVKGIIENRELISEEEAKNILGTNLFNEVKYGNRNDWDGHMLSSAEAENVRKLLVTASGINQQRYQANQDAAMYRNNAEASGITQEAAKIVFADANNLAKGSATAIAASARAKVGGDGSKVTWELLLEEYENHSSLGGNEYKQRRVRLNKLLTEWYGSSPEQPPVVDSPNLDLIVYDSNNSPVDLSSAKLISGEFKVIVDNVPDSYSNNTYIQLQNINSASGKTGETVYTLYSGKKLSEGRYQFNIDTSQMANDTYQMAAFAWATDGNYVSSDYCFLKVSESARYGFKLNNEWIKNNETIKLTLDEAKHIEVSAVANNNIDYNGNYITRSLGITQSFSCIIGDVYKEELPMVFLQHTITDLAEGKYTVNLKLSSGYSAKIILHVSDNTSAPEIEGNVFQQRWQYGENNQYDKPANEWGNYQYGYSNSAGTKAATIGSSGCCLLSITNAVFNLNGTFIDPVVIADYSVQNNLRINGVGSSAALPNKFADALGDTYHFSCSSAIERPLNKDKRTEWVNTLIAHLKLGGTAVVRIPGHYMSIVDWKIENGKDLFLLYDSEVSKGRKTDRDGNWKSTDELLEMAGPSSKSTGEYGVTRYYLVSQK